MKNDTRNCQVFHNKRGLRERNGKKSRGTGNYENPYNPIELE